jgi:hypothetical protein
MTAVFLQIAVTIWLGTHPVRHVLPKIYFEASRCERVGLALAARQKTKHRIEIECVLTDKRDI